MDHPLDRRLLLSAAGLVGLGSMGAMSARGAAGPLDPPAGPVGSTAKPLSEVEPRIAINDTNTPATGSFGPARYRITQRGSYYLTENLNVPVGLNAIEVNAGDVEIDLNGFSIVGLGNNSFAINVVNFTGNITVRNGTVRDCGRVIMPPDAPGFRLFDIRCFGGVNGIHAGANAVVERCFVSGTSQAAIVVGTGSLVTDCQVQNCSTNGAGFSAINANDGSIVRRCSVTNSQGSGFSLTDSAALDCNASFNGREGFVASRAVIENCTANGNGLEGFKCQDQVRIERCASRRNLGANYSLGTHCFAIGNAAQGRTSTQGVNYLVTGVRNRLEDNSATFGAKGFEVNGTSNFLVRNTSSGTSANWYVVAGNVCLVQLVNFTSALINSNAGGVAPGSADPNSNYTY